MATNPMEKATGITFRDAEEAFNDAIKSGRLSASRFPANSAYRFMYMGTDAKGKDLFKNIDTREYLA